MKNPLLNPVVFAAALLSACQMGAPSEALELKSDRDPVQIMVSIGKTAQACWFKSKDPGFGGFRLADETHSPAGRPRLLLVPRRDPGGLPKLVISAEKAGGATDIQVYGPALATSLGARIAGGCTSGHGISGMAQLSVGSMVAVAAMFAGGILTATLLMRRV